MLVEQGNTCLGIHHVKAFTNLNDVGNLVGVRLIHDVADQLFKDVLKRYHAGESAELIQNNCHVHTAQLQFAQKIIDLLRLGYAVHIIHQCFHKCTVVSCGVGIEQIFDVECSDNVVDVVMVHRHPRVPCVAEVGNHILKGGDKVIRIVLQFFKTFAGSSSLLGKNTNLRTIDPRRA